MKNEFGKLYKKSYREQDSIDKRGKRNYQERIAEEKEAERDIKNYKEAKEIELIDTDDNPTF